MVKYIKFLIRLPMALIILVTIPIELFLGLIIILPLMWSVNENFGFFDLVDYVWESINFFIETIKGEWNG